MSKWTSWLGTEQAISPSAISRNQEIGLGIKRIAIKLSELAPSNDTETYAVLLHKKAKERLAKEGIKASANDVLYLAIYDFAVDVVSLGNNENNKALLVMRGDKAKDYYDMALSYLNKLKLSEIDIQIKDVRGEHFPIR